MSALAWHRGGETHATRHWAAGDRGIYAIVRTDEGLQLHVYTHSIRRVLQRPVTTVTDGKALAERLDARGPRFTERSRPSLSVSRLATEAP